MPDTRARRALLNAASKPYLKAGPGLFAYFFARGKLSQDPVYRAILQRGLLQDRERILDLGCGQALLTAWLRAATRLHDRGTWPAGWATPPRPHIIRGIELMARDVYRARRALGADTTIEIGDIRDIDFGSADAVVVLDVLHYIEAAAQCKVLLRIHSALPPGGLLLLRVGDAAGGLRHRCSEWVDKWVMVTRGHALKPPHCRPLAEWQSLLDRCGFRSEAVPMSQGTPFANVLLIAEATDRHPA